MTWQAWTPHFFVFLFCSAIHLFSVFVWKHSKPCAWWYEVDFIWWCGLVWWYMVHFSLVCWCGQSLLIFRVSELVSMFMIYVVLGDLVNLNRTYMMMRIIIWWIMAMTTIITIVQKWQFPFPSKFNDEAHVLMLSLNDTLWIGVDSDICWGLFVFLSAMCYICQSRYLLETVELRNVSWRYSKAVAPSLCLFLFVKSCSSLLKKNIAGHKITMGRAGLPRYHSKRSRELKIGPIVCLI